MKKIKLNDVTVGDVIDVVRVDDEIISVKSFNIDFMDFVEFDTFLISYIKDKKIHSAIGGGIDFSNKNGIPSKKVLIPSLSQVIQIPNYYLLFKSNYYLLFKIEDDGIYIYTSTDLKKWSKCGKLIDGQIGNICLLPTNNNICLWYSLYNEEAWSIYHSIIDKYDIIKAIEKE